jgi:hypothetical protein
MSKYIRYVCALIGLLVAGRLAAETPVSDDLAEKAFTLLKERIEENRRNDLAGFSYRNNYVIEINLDSKWIEERGKGKTVIVSKYQSISEHLDQFNNKRTDKLRAYVIVVNDWELRLKQHVDIDLLPSTVKFNSISSQAEESQKAEKERIKKELSLVPAEINKRLKAAGYTDLAICFGARAKFYTLDENGEPEAREYKYSNVYLFGTTLKAYDKQIRAKVIHSPGGSLEGDVEVKVFSMTDGIEQVVDHRVPHVLAYKVSNSTVNSWFSTLGEKTTDPYSGVSTAKQFYDYTGVFTPVKQKLIDQLPDPTAQIIVTDNLTSTTIINNIKAQVAKPLVANVFWFHLDRKGELHTQLYLAESVKERYQKVAPTMPNDLETYIGSLYKEAGPKFKSVSDVIDYFNITSRVFKALASVLKKGTIPDSWWDASHPDYLLGVWGKYISPQTGLTFAYLCGIWNGIIGNLEMVAGLATMVSDMQGAFMKILVDKGYRDDLFEDIAFYTTHLGTLMEFGYEIVKSEISRKVSAEWEKLKDGDATGLSYVGGLVTVEIVIGIFTAGAVDAVKAGLMTFKIIRVPLEAIANASKWLMRPFVYILKSGGKIIVEAGQYVLKSGEKIIVEAGEFLLKQGDEIIAKIGANGKLVIYKVLAFGEKVVEEIPIPQMVLAVDRNGAAMLEFAWVRTQTGWGFKKRSEFLQALAKSLDNFPALRDKVLLMTKDFQSKFIDDFLTNADDNVLTQLSKDVRVLDGWKRLDGSPLRMDLRYMELVRQLPGNYTYKASGDIVKVFDAQGKEIAEMSKDMIKAKGGQTGAWNDLLNKPPVPDHKYLIDNYLYETDAAGRVKRVSGVLEDIERGRLTSQQTGSVALKEGLPGDEGGHLLAQILNGPGEQINYLPQKESLNQGAWKTMEMMWRDELRAGSKVTVDIRPSFTGGSKRPNKFDVEYWIEKTNPTTGKLEKIYKDLEFTN